VYPLIVYLKLMLNSKQSMQQILIIVADQIV